MGRRRDDPRDQAAKGYPSRRRRQTKAQLAALAAMEEAAARDAALFAANADGADLQALPAFLADKRLAAAQTIWRDYAPRLDRLHLLSTLDRQHFAMFCIYAAEFVLANRTLLDNGYETRVLTVVGAKLDAHERDDSAYMLRENPALSRRDYAAEMMLKLGEKFGFTPLDRNKLIAAHAMRNDEETLFGRQRTLPIEPESAPPAAPAAAGEAALGIGSMAELSAASPGKLN